MRFLIYKIFAVLMAAVMLAGCGIKDNGENSSTADSSSVSEAQQSENTSSIKEQSKTVTVTIPEGYTIRRIADKLAENGVCAAEDFIDVLENGEFTQPFIEKIKPAELSVFKLEGYVFPDTYEFYKDESAQSVADKFLTNFEEKFTEEMWTALDNSGMTLNQAITLASIIQKECSEHTQMKLVSSVFHNRLNSKDFPRLQSDVTKVFVTGYIRPFIEDVKLQDKLADAYNTYKCKGLPPGAICSPSLDAIKAALTPDQSEYYYFLTDKAGKYYYAKEFATHEANWEEAKKINAKLEEDA